MVSRFRNRKYPKKNGRKKPFSSSTWRAPVSLCPDRMFTKLKYSEAIAFTQTGALSDFIFRLNCTVDCNVTSPGAGKYAYGQPQWWSMYNRCYVTSSKITLKILNDDPTIGGNSVLVTLFPSNSFAPIAVSQEANMRARRKTTILQSTSDTKTLTSNASTKSIIGKGRDSQMEYPAVYTSPVFPPIADAYWHCVFELINGVPGPMTCLVDIEYSTVFFDRRQELGAVVAPGPAA